MLATILLTAISLGAGSGVALAHFAIPSPEQALQREHDRLIAAGWRYVGKGEYRK